MLSGVGCKMRNLGRLSDYDEDAHTLRLSILDQLSERTSKTKDELYADVCRDFGECDVRRFYRNLRFLIDRGCAEKLDEGELHPVTHQRVPTYRRGPADPPRPVSRWCLVCLALGKRTPRPLCIAGTAGIGGISPHLLYAPGTPEISRSMSRRSRPLSSRPANVAKRARRRARGVEPYFLRWLP